MPHFDAYLFNKKGVRRNVTIILDEGDGIIESIRAAMNEHKISEAKLDALDGTIRDGVINFFERNQFKSANLKDAKVMIASGNFKLSYGEIFGGMKVATETKPPMHGTFVKGKAAEGLTINLSFLEYVDK